MKSALSIGALLLTLCSCAAADTIPPVSVVCSGELNSAYPCSALIDGVTNDSAPGIGAASYWLGRDGVPNETFTLNLGSEHWIYGFNIFTTHNGLNIFNDRGTLAFTIWLSQTPVTPNTYSSSFGTDVLDSSLAFYPDEDPNTVQSFTITPTYAQYLTFRATSMQYNGSGLSEIQAFAPEPATFLLAGIALAALGAVRRRSWDWSGQSDRSSTFRSRTLKKFSRNA